MLKLPDYRLNSGLQRCLHRVHTRKKTRETKEHDDTRILKQKVCDGAQVFPEDKCLKLSCYPHSGPRLCRSPCSDPTGLQPSHHHRFPLRQALATVRPPVTCCYLSGWLQSHIPGYLRGWQYKECCLQPEHTWQWTHLSRQASWRERHQKYSHHQHASTLRLISRAKWKVSYTSKRNVSLKLTFFPFQS